jgi:hypothetical protein
MGIQRGVGDAFGIDDASVLPELLGQIPADMPAETVGGDGVCDTKQGHAMITARGAQPKIFQR